MMFREDTCNLLFLFLLYFGLTEYPTFNHYFITLHIFILIGSQPEYYNLFGTEITEQVP